MQIPNKKIIKFAYAHDITRLEKPKTLYNYMMEYVMIFHFSLCKNIFVGLWWNTEYGINKPN